MSNNTNWGVAPTNIEKEDDTRVPQNYGKIDKTGIYNVKILECYKVVSKSGAVGATIKVGLVENPKITMTQTVYAILSGNEKGNKATYTRKVKHPETGNEVEREFLLPDGVWFDNIIKACLGHDKTKYSLANPVRAMVKKYNNDTNRYEDTEVESFGDLVGKTFYAGIVMTVNFKSQFDASTNSYVTTKEFGKPFPIIERAFDSQHRVASEAEKNLPAKVYEEYKEARPEDFIGGDAAEVYKAAIADGGAASNTATTSTPPTQGTVSPTGGFGAEG